MFKINSLKLFGVYRSTTLQLWRFNITVPKLKRPRKCPKLKRWTPENAQS
ncbi:MAG: hypothetical protein KAI83_01370 [Thiomargarita sp.]|nr:hypothetical protein [Thiomargarita sp.]